MIASLLLRLIARITAYNIKTWSSRPVQTQEKQFKYLIKRAKKTAFGLDHNFQEIASYKDFVKNVPVRGYEGIKPYVEMVKKGERNILWPGKPIYFALTSGTTSGSKYIPITKESLKNHLNGAKNAILNYVAQTKKTSFIKGKFIFIQGSPLLDKISKILINDLNIFRNYFSKSFHLIKSFSFKSHLTFLLRTKSKYFTCIPLAGLINLILSIVTFSPLFIF